MSSTTEDPDHAESISQLINVTGTDETRARSLLVACDWNLELAVNMHIDDNVRPPIKPKNEILVQNPISYAPSDLSASSGLGTSHSRRYNTRTGAASGSFDAFRDYKAEADWQERVSDPSEANSTNNSTSRAKSLHELFRPPIDLMFRSSWDAVRDEGNNKNKWLLVNLQDSREFACQTLNRDVWSNPTVKDIVRESFIFWQVNHDSHEGARFVQFYNVKRFPHLSIIDPRTGEQMRLWPTNVDHSLFCDSVIEFLTENPTPDKRCAKPPKIEEVTLDDTIEEVQEKMIEEVQELQDDYKDPEDHKEPLEDYKKYIGVDSEKCDIVVRYPDGSRQQFSFPSDTSMKALFLLFSSQGYETDQYNYVTTFPRRLLHELPATQTFNEAKLSKENIIVERRTD